MGRVFRISELQFALCPTRNSNHGERAAILSVNGQVVVSKWNILQFHLELDASGTAFKLGFHFRAVVELFHHQLVTVVTEVGRTTQAAGSA